MHRATESVTGKYCLEVTWQGIHTKGGKGKPNMVLLNWLFRRLRWVDGFKTNMGSTARQQKKTSQESYDSKSLVEKGKRSSVVVVTLACMPSGG